MNLSIVKTIAHRDLLIVTRSKGVLLPMIVLPVFLMMLLPGLIGYFGPVLADQFPSELDDIKVFLERMPVSIADELSPFNEIQTMVVVFINYLFAPFFLIMPIMVASNIAASTFAGEKERKTMEALLYTPARDEELFLGKFLSAWIPAVIVSLLSFIIYGVTANLAAWRTMGQLFFPNVMWLILAIWVSPAAAGFGLVTMVLVSSRATTYQEASQIGGVVVLPVVLLMLGQVSGVMYLNPVVVFLLGVSLYLLDALILRFAIRTFKREQVITKI